MDEQRAKMRRNAFSFERGRRQIVAEGRSWQKADRGRRQKTFFFLMDGLTPRTRSAREAIA